MGENLNAETFAEYGIGIFFLSLRLVARLYLGGFRGLRLDDAFAVAAMIFFTIQTVNIYEMGILGNNIGLNAETAMLVPDSQIPDMVLGSKLAFMNWIWYMSYIWCLKGVLLCLYWKLTAGTWHQHLVTGTSVFCVMTWLGCVLTHVCLCTPVYRNWQIQPYPGDYCTLRQPLYYEIAILNVISDCLIILIPIPILTKLQVPLQRKLILAIMFSSGIFIMVCTILRAHYSLASITTLSIALGWADRECFVAAIVASLPGIKPLFRNTRFLGSTNRKQSRTPYDNSGAINNFRSKDSGTTKTFISSKRDASRVRDFELESVLQTKNMGSRMSSADSDEYILSNVEPTGSSAPASHRDAHGRNDLAIHVTTEYSLETEQNSRVGV